MKVFVSHFFPTVIWEKVSNFKPQVKKRISSRTKDQNLLTFCGYFSQVKGGRRKRSYWPCKSKSSSTCKMVSHFIHPLLTSSLPFMLPFSHISIVNVGGNASPTLIFCCQNHCEAGVRPPPFFARWPPVPLPLFHPLLGLLRRVRVKVWMRDSDWENRAGGGNSPFKRIVMECATQGSRVGVVSIEGWTMISLVKCIQAELKFG